MQTHTEQFSPKRNGRPRVAKVAAARRRVGARLQLAAPTIGGLAPGIAHDLNIILMAILSNADLLSLRTATDDPRRSYIEEIRDAVSRGTGLARQLTTFDGERPLRPARVDLNEVIGAMATLLRRLTGSRIHLVTTLSPAVGTISADPTQIEQIILNLVTNARDAMPEGGTMTIETAVVPDPEADGPEARGCVQLSVTDTGCGMSEAVRARIFDSHFTTKEQDGSRGLGLTSVHGIVERHGGFIEVDSVEGRGSTFRVLFPRGESPAPAH